MVNIKTDGTKQTSITEWGIEPELRYFTLTQGTAQPWVKTWYDARGRKVRTESRSEGNVSVYEIPTYNKKGEVTSRVSINGDLTTSESYTYDDRVTHSLSTGKSTSNASDKVYYPCTDHLGSIIKLVDANGTEAFKATYDAWGQQTVTTNTLNFHRGYTMHEHLPQFALINMNGRMYDPLLGRFLSPDPFVQLPDFSQNFNRYSYCLNNPLVYVDPDGEWIWLVAGVAGGLINWVSNGADLSWEGLSYFGVGFASGVVTAFCPQAYIGIAAANSVANSVLNQGYTNGFNNISWQQTLFDGAMGGAFATVGGALGEKFGAPVQKLFKGVKSPLLREVLVAETIGVPMGAGIGGFMAEMDGNDETSFWDGAWEGAKMSFITSGIGGIASAAQYSMEKKVSIWEPETAKYSVYQGLDPITGEVKYVGITKRDPEVRWKEHLNSDSPRAGLEYKKVDNATGLTKIQARIIEQQLINRYGLMKNGGQLYNKINSISPKYWDKYGIK